MEPNSSPNTPTAAADASVRVPGAPHEPAGPAAGAHIDTFARDHLPPPDQWPELLLDDPAPHYPDRLNCGHELLDRTVEEFGADRPALRSGDGTVWSYGELRETVDRVAHVLTEDLGVVPGNRVLLRGPTTPWLAACWLAVMKAGAIAVTVLAQARASELATICSLARIGHALCDARSTADLAEAGVTGLRVTGFGGDGPADLTRLAAAHSGSGPYRAVDTAADEVALIAFTSGTTGRPKGCMHLHRDLLAIADTFSAQVLRPSADDVFTGSPPLGFTFGLGGLLVFPLRAGASTLLLEQAGPKQLLPALARHRVSVLFTAPTAYRTMLGQLNGHDLSALRRCVSAGENLPAATWQAWYEATGLRIINGIGATELLHIFISAADDAIRPGTTGVPVPGWQARVVDEHGDELPDGEAGLLAVRGPVGCRYLADPRQTEYVRHGWNLTGDTFVREPDGYFRYVARADDMIISSGYNIAGPEVEDALLRHPEVAEAAVVGRADELRGEIVVAHVVLTEGSEQTADSLRAHMKAHLAPHKCPRVFVFEDSLPRTATGKLQRFLLREDLRKDRA
ncbi:AMP-binding protein [Streptomyces sp. ID03-2B]|uniref:AMP-binding protein n=1 Tax=Streptomyces caviscabies TaxID=90079 RepID=A0ABW2ME08_9ACTN|nr:MULTISPECIES: AMP-binding protein [Streptomyces]MCX4712276.1 AMP-binding protein [Streptomyces griseus]MDX2671841.1 AMP-binding protein [Streptomyces sp. NRRL_ISP-5395]MDX3341375.1 AMP-binding protein [Streptomyces sp. ME02-6979.5a]MDX3502141.1 AMP-binding protein [Streptomyces sp. ATCC51928]MDX3592313.1 AMP-binding protein [Streptomyces sp. ID03-2B]